MAKFKVDFDGFTEVMARLKKLDGDVKTTTETALKKTHEIVTDKAEQAIAPHKKTGRTERSLQKQAKVNWIGTTASVDVGFDIHNGGLASIFLMHGAKVYGTPRTPKDQKLYDAFFSTKTKKEVREAQEEVFYNEIRKLGG